MDINYLAVAFAALAAFFLGFIWYTFIFAKPWQALIGMGSKGKGKASTQQTPDLGRLLIMSLILEIIMAFALAAFLGRGAGAVPGLTYGLVVGVWVAAAFGVNYMYEGKPLKLWLINAGYNLVVFAVMGLIIGAM
ncbi:MAG: DUF1761 domain-containing protein [Anaerolineales bacterium]|nr:DUF1761 domain-containing protein [Anaerolineales bacterium]